MRREKALEPWTELGKVLAKGREEAHEHPPEPVLLAYFQGKLPPKPEQWTDQRLQALVQGHLLDWTAAEVRAHLAACSMCRRKVLQWQGATVLKPVPHRVRLFGNPRLAWALAGVQALALIAAVLWFTLSPTPSSPKPEFSLPSEFTTTSLLTARLVPNPEVTVAQLNTVLQTYGIVIVNGPDEEGAYIVMGEKEALEAISTNQIVESITIQGR